MLGLGLSFARQTAKVFSYVKDSLKAYFRFYDTTPDFLFDGSTFFDDTNDYISLTPVSPAGTWSISFWFKATIQNNGGIYTNVSGTSNYISIAMWDGKIQMNCTDTGTGRSTTNTYNDGVWHHAVLIKKDTSNCSAIYIDGQLASSDTSNNWAGTNTRDEHTIGVAEYGSDYYYGGHIACLGLWNREVSASEVESIYWRGAYSELKGTELTNLTAWYNLFSTSAGSELITNGDFSSFSSGEATSWTKTGSPTLSEETTIVQSGSSQKIFMATSGNNGINQDITTVEGAEYTFSAKVYVTGGRARIILDNGTDDGQTYVGTGGSTGYEALNTWHTVTFTKTSQGTSMTVRLWTSSADTTFYVDDVSLKLVSETPDSAGTNHGAVAGATINTDSYSGESPFKPRIQDIATPKMAVQLADGSTDFDGSNDYITGMANNPSGNFTISAWINPDSISDGAIYSGNAFELMLRPESNKLKMHVGGASNTEVTTADLTVGVWQHVCGTWDGSNAKLYVNGSLEPSSTNGTLSNPSSGTTQIGKYSLGSQNYYNGKMANVAIYSSALTQSQVQELMFTEKYSGLSADLKTNLVSWYDLGARVQTGSDVVYDETNASLGDELITNGDFSSALGSEWDLTEGAGGGSITIVNGQLKFLQSSSTNMYASQDFTTEVGATYHFSIDLASTSGTAWIRLFVGTSQNGTQILNSGYNSQSIGTNYLSFVATATTTWITIHDAQGGGSSSVWDNVSVKKVSGNAGIVYGATTTTGYTSSPHGVVDPLNFGEVYSGRALSFDGSNDIVKTDNNITDFPFSVSCHFRTGSSFATGNIFSFTDASTINEYWGMLVDGSGNLSVIRRNTTEVVTDTGFDCTVSTWYHMVAIWDSATTATVYINGQSVYAGTGLTSVSIDNTFDKFLIGYLRDSSPTYYWNGKISNVKVFNSVLTEAQVQELYTKPETVLPTGVSASNLKIDLPIQEGAGSYIYDGSGNQNHGIISGATWATGEKNGYQSSLVRSNTPMVFDGSNDYVSFSDTGLPSGSSARTVAGWVYFDAINQNEVWFSYGTAGTNTAFFLGQYTDNKHNIGFYGNNYRSSSNAVAKQWTHICAVFEGTSLKIYLNGSLDVDRTVTGTVNTTLNAGVIGNLVGNSTYHSGLINEVAVWDVALDADAVTALYGSGTPLLPTSDSGNYDNSDNLVGYWRNDGIVTWTDRTPLGAYGSDMITNGGFDSDTVWTRQSGWTIGSGVATCDGTNASYVYQSSGTGGLPQNTKISVSLDITSYTSGSVRIGATTVTSDTVSGLGTHTAIFTTRSGGDSGIEILSNSFIGSIDNVVIKKHRGGNDGTASNATTSIVIPEGSTEGRDNQGFLLSDTTSISNGIRLHGGGEYVSIQDSEVFSFGDGTDDKPFSIESWVKMDDATSFTIASKGIYNSTAEWKFGLGSDDALILIIYDESVASTYEYGLYTTTLTSYEGQWVHLSGTYDGRGGTSATDGISLYVNGSPVTTSTGGAGTYVAMENLGADVHIGRENTAYANGLIDEVRIYQKELSASEVLKNYNSGKSSHS